MSRAERILREKTPIHRKIHRFEKEGSRTTALDNCSALLGYVENDIYCGVASGWKEEYVGDKSMSKNENLSLSTLGERLTSLDLVEVKDKKVVANTAMMDQYLDALKKHNDDIISNELDVEVVNMEIKQQKDTFKGFVEFRKGYTEPMKAVSSELTERENKVWKLEIQRLEKHQKMMMEETFKVAEKVIKNELERLLDENQQLGLSLSTFDSFIQVQREKKGMLPNQKGNLSATSTKKIDEEFEKLAKPVREAQALQEQQEKEQKQFETYLPDTNSNSIEELEATKITLMKLDQQVDELYPSIKDHCHRAIKSKISLIEGNIRTLEAVAKQKEAEARESELKQADSDLVKRLDEIELGVCSGLTKEALNTILEEIRGFYESIKFAENQTRAKALAESIKMEISAIELAEQVNVEPEVIETEVVTETFTVTATPAQFRELVKFMKEKGMRYE